MLIRPVLVRESAAPQQCSRAKEIVELHGGTSLARFALFTDKSYFFPPGGSVIAFVPKGRVALVLGDPIGPADDVTAALDAFKQKCACGDWFPVYYQTLPDNLEHYKSRGFDVLMIGQEAVVDLSAFTLEGKAGKEFRTTLNKWNDMAFKPKYTCHPLLIIWFIACVKSAMNGSQARLAVS